MSKKKKILIIILSILLAIILGMVGTFFIITQIGKNQFHKEDTHISTSEIEKVNEDTISYNGKNYMLNKNIVSVLVMGVDRDSIEENLGSGNNGQADVIFVATIDTSTKKTCIIPISRETMVDVNLFTSEGAYAGTTYEQLCLAYAYGNNIKECSENVLKSVRRLLYGINVTSYLTIEMKAIENLTDMVGGIEVNAIENINAKKLTTVKGQRTVLNGEKARVYISYRDDDIEANTRRMARQKQFLSALMNKTGNAILNDFTKLSEFYNTLSPYYNTNVSFAQITYLAQNCLVKNFGDSLEYKTIEGTHTEGEKWVEFHADQDSLLQTVIDVFYVPVE